MIWIANMTLESKVKVKYTYNQAVCIVMPISLTFFDRGYSYLTKCWPRCLDDKKAFGVKVWP